MKGLELNVTKQNGMTLVEYRLGTADVYDDRVADKVAPLGNIVPFQYKDEDGKRSVISYVHKDNSLEMMLKQTLKKADVLAILKGLLCAFEVGAAGVQICYLVRDTNYIYVDPESLAVKCLMVPVKQDPLGQSDIPDFFRNIVSRMRFDEADRDNYVARILTLINEDHYSNMKLRELVDVEMEKMNLLYTRDEGIKKDTSAIPETPNKEIKVNRVGVMNNMRPQGQPMPPMGQPMPPMGGQPMPPMGGQPMPPMGQPMPPMGQPMPPMGGQPMPPMGGQPMPPMGGQPMPPMGGQPMPPMGGQPMPQGMPVPPMGQAPQMPKPEAPKPQEMPKPEMPKPQGMPVPPMGQAPQMPKPEAPKPQEMTKPEMPKPQGMPVPPMGQAPQMPKPEAPKPQEMPKPEMPKPQGMPVPPMGQAPQMPKPEMPKPQGMPKPEMPKPQGMPVPPMGQAPQMPKPEAPKPQEMSKPEMPKPQGMPVPPMGQAPQMPKPEAPKPQEMPKPEMPKPEMPKPQGMPKPEMPKPQGMPVPPMGQAPQMPNGSLMGQLSGARPVPHLVRKTTGEVINITKSEFILGKSKTKADYTIENNNAISREHCTIIQHDGVNYIKDNNSTNHTYVNGVELQPGKEVLLKHKTDIRMGDEEFVFLLRKGE